MSKPSAVEESIKHCIKKNGFPEKCVRLPFKAIHQSCKNHNISLKEVLANLIQEKIVGTVQGDFIEFQTSDKPQQKTKAPSKKNEPPWANLTNMENLSEMAQSYMSKMSPDQIKELEKTIASMNEEEKKNIIQNFSKNMFNNKP